MEQKEVDEQFETLVKLVGLVRALEMVEAASRPVERERGRKIDGQALLVDEAGKPVVGLEVRRGEKGEFEVLRVVPTAMLK
jgi:hypothetical protein